MAQEAGAAGSYSRREQVGWYFYDWANSAFSTTVVSVFLGPYLSSVTRSAADAAGFVYPLGLQIRAEAFFPYMISLSVLLQVLFLPILGAIADYSHRKKQLLLIFAYLGAFATMGLYFLEGSNYLLGGTLFVIANLAFGASIVFYNAFLPDIAPAEQRDRVSSEGWALGYLGGGLLLAANLVLFQSAASFGIASGDAVRISMTSAGIWWAIFSLIPLATLRQRQPARALPAGQRILTVGFRQLSQTIRAARRYPQTLLFLVAYLLYNDGIQTVIGLASTFGADELKLEQSTLISAILMVQFVAFFGAVVLGRLAGRFGAKQVILGSLIIWTGTVTYAFFMPAGDDGQFYLLAAAIAIVLGGSQALSRSLFAQMIPPGQEAEYFSLYEVSERGTSWLGPLLFGLALQYTDSYRIAIISLMVFFIAGFIVLTRVDIRRAIAESQRVE
ncbi:MAG TPA: MFS transporter [Roseiflexaceae bacterium]|nr:MFS transporter [Roseiflexaceae bacterium]HMP40947.1 MFS transporter [Roseiflexaceae bacterium]